VGVYRTLPKALGRGTYGSIFSIYKSYIINE
jgi:hypothetical protein